MGGIPILCDSENSTDISLLIKMGLLVGEKAEEAKVHKLVYVPVRTVEDFFENAEFMVKKIRELGSKKFITIVWDSIAGTPSQAEIEGNFTKEGYGTQKALAISLAMRKVTQFLYKEDVLFVFTNQVRANVGGFGYGDKMVTPGGHAVPFHASVRIRLNKLEDIKRTVDKKDTVIGVRIQAQTRKNKIAPPLRKCTFDVYFDRGIDDANSWFENLLEKGTIKKSGQSYKMDFPSGEETFARKDWADIVRKHHALLLDMVIKANTIDYTNISPKLLETGTDDIQSTPEEDEILTEQT